MHLWASHDRPLPVPLGVIMLIIVGFAGYILPVPCLIWAWIRWWKTRPHFAPDEWRRVGTFAGLILATLVGLFVRFVIGENARKRDIPLAGVGLMASMFALALSLMGKEKTPSACLHLWPRSVWRLYGTSADFLPEFLAG